MIKKGPDQSNATAILKERKSKNAMELQNHQEDMLQPSGW